MLTVLGPESFRPTREAEADIKVDDEDGAESKAEDETRADVNVVTYYIHGPASNDERVSTSSVCIREKSANIKTPS